MALQISLSSGISLRHSSSSTSSSGLSPNPNSINFSDSYLVKFGARFSQRLSKKKEFGRDIDVCVRSSSLETAGVEVVVGQVTEVNKDTFWPLVHAAEEKIVVLDMYTQWCGPCKVIAPKFQELSEKNLDVVFMKLDCNKENKSLAKELGLRVVPTFKIMKSGKIAKEVTGAKLDDLVLAIDSVKSSS